MNRPVQFKVHPLLPSEEEVYYQVEWAKFIDKDNQFNHASVLGAWFTKEKLPVTAKFLADVTEDANAVGALTNEGRLPRNACELASETGEILGS